MLGPLLWSPVAPQGYPVALVTCCPLALARFALVTCCPLCSGHLRRLPPMALLWSRAAPWLWSLVAPLCSGDLLPPCSGNLLPPGHCSGHMLPRLLWSPVARLLWSHVARIAVVTCCFLALVACCPLCSGHLFPPLLWSPVAPLLWSQNIARSKTLNSIEHAWKLEERTLQSEYQSKTHKTFAFGNTF